MQNLISAVEKHKQLILDTERYVWKNPETGYKEVKTSKYMAEAFEKLGYTLTYAEGITGFYTMVDTGREGPEILVLGELDSIICPEHPEADKETGAVHSCGHCAQCGALIGVAAALKEEGALDDLCGKIKLCAVPAEELLEIEFRSNLVKEGKIKYFGGKAEFMHRGYFDTCDIAFMLHTSTRWAALAGAVGIVAKQIVFEGKAAHAGGAPWDGINALYAANCGLSAVNALRETFKEEDIIRFHPIITSGGSMVNAIPSKTTVESYVRGKTYEAIKNANRKINQALAGGALSMGANVNIIDFPGYAPLKNDENLINIYNEATQIVVPGDKVEILPNTYSSGSTDMGDLSQVMPVVHPYAAGGEGRAHGSDYYIKDPIRACVDSAKIQVVMLYLLLSKNGERAKKVIAEYKAPFASIEEYLKYIDSLNFEGNRISYDEEGVATVNIKI